MKSLKQIESEITENQQRITEKQRLDLISKFPGAEELEKLFQDTKQFYEQVIRNLDENSPILAKEYAKNKACLALVNSFIAGLKSAEDDLILLKQEQFLLREEQQKTLDEIKRREKASY